MNDDLIYQEIADGQGITLSKAARRFPSNRNDRPVTLSCLLRWVLDGVLNTNGERIKLEAARCAGRWLTTPAAIQRFIARQTPDTSGSSTPPRSPSARQRASERAARALDKIGI